MADLHRRRRRAEVESEREGTFLSKRNEDDGGRPKGLFDVPYLFTPPTLTFQYYDVSGDGQRFLMVKQLQESAQPINVTLNWIEEMKRSMPAGTK